ncbi:uncharacterized protein LOC144640730, partial [Oculina patagonica]
MELFPKVVFSAIFVITLNVAVQSAPSSLKSPPSRTELLIKVVLAPRVANATQEIKNLYPFITSTNDLEETMLMLGVVVTKRCFINQQLKDKLTVAYMKLSNYISPLYMAYSYEEKQGLQHIQLAQVLRETSFYLNSTVTTLRHELLRRKFPLPAGQVILEEKQLNQYTREYLQILVDKKVLTLVITDNVVKIYRNYVILYTLHDVISEVFTCVAGV